MIGSLADWRSLTIATSVRVCAFITSCGALRVVPHSLPTSVPAASPPPCRRGSSELSEVVGRVGPRNDRG